MRKHTCLSGYQEGKVRNCEKAQQPTDSLALSLLPGKITLLESKVSVGRTSQVRKYASLTSLNRIKARPVSPDGFCHLSVTSKVPQGKSLIHLQSYNSTIFMVRTQWHLWRFSVISNPVKVFPVGTEAQSQCHTRFTEQSQAYLMFTIVIMEKQCRKKPKG